MSINKKINSTLSTVLFLALLLLMPFAIQYYKGANKGNKTLQIQPAHAQQLANGTVEIWWPAPNATVSGVQPFKALVQGKDVSQYQMFWQVDGGQLNAMADNFTDLPHKEAAADVANWQWRGSGPYIITFVAKENGIETARKDTAILVGSAAASLVSASASPSVSTQKTTAPASLTSTGGSLAGYKLFRSGDTQAKLQADAWRAARPADTALLDKIASEPQSIWLGEWSGNAKEAAQLVSAEAARAGKLPVFVAYRIPYRDCGQYSAGGVSSADEYRAWIEGVAAGIGSRPAAVILEPDALANITCLSSGAQAERYQMLKEAVKTLKANAKTFVYLDAGHALWLQPAEAAKRLKSAGIASADGFSLNISNFITTNESRKYGHTVSDLVGGKHFIIDVSRNGAGPSPDKQWCNPPGRALGERPTTKTGFKRVDAYLWVKAPGESDGPCNGGPGAGAFWPEYAIGLAERAKW